MDKDLDLNTSPALPMGDDHLADASEASKGGMSDADARRGYATMTVSSGYTVALVDDQDVSGENCVGDPFTRGGFLNRPEGWER